MKKQNSDDGWRGLRKLLSDIVSPEQMEVILHLFLTIDERRDLADRYLIVKHLLGEKLTQREMAAKLGVSISKITRGSNSLKLIDDQTLQQLKNQIN